MEPKEEKEPDKSGDPGKDKPKGLNIPQLADTNPAGGEKEARRDRDISDPFSSVEFGGCRGWAHQRQFKLKPALPAHQGAHFATMLLALVGFDLLTVAFATIRHSKILQR